MSRSPVEIGDFGLTSKPISRTQVVAVYDLVGFTQLLSNVDLVTAISLMETQIKLTLSPLYYWDERTRGGVEKSINNILIRSTGDGFFIAFSHNIDDHEALNALTSLYTGIRRHHPVKLGINKGENYVIQDINERVNIIGWGINLAARALHFASENQIICTSYFAKPLLDQDGDQINEDIMKDMGVYAVKDTELHLYNYYNKGKFGAPITQSQRKLKKRVSRVSPKMMRAVRARAEPETASSVIKRKTAASSYDVFLCHNSEDKSAVKAIGNRLKKEGILPWLDEWDAQPGLDWQELLEKQVEHIKAAAVFVGSKGIGPWQLREIRALLSEFVDRGATVIPVLLEDAPHKDLLPLFIRNMTWVDFREKDPDPIERLIWGITGIRQ